MNTELLFLPNNKNMGQLHIYSHNFQIQGKIFPRAYGPCPMNFLDNLELKNLLWIIINEN
jgi:hypothetical protein